MIDMTSNQLKANLTGLNRSAKNPAVSQLRLIRTFVRHASNDDLEEFLEDDDGPRRCYCRSKEDRRNCREHAAQAGFAEAREALWQVSYGYRLYTDLQWGAIQ